MIALILALPAKSLRDAVVQLHHLPCMLDALEADDPPAHATAALRSAIASISAAVLGLSGLDYIGSGIDFTEMLDQWTNLHLVASKVAFRAGQQG